MCKVMEELNELAAQRAVKEERRSSINEMLKDGLSKNKIMKYLHLSEDEFDRLTSTLAG